jgi:hypothetical protein
VPGTLGGAALGIGAGIAWAGLPGVEIFKTTSFEGDSGMLVFFTFISLGATIGGSGSALLFGVIAIRDAEIAIRKGALAPARAASDAVSLSRSRICAMQKSRLHLRPVPLFEASNT